MKPLLSLYSFLLFIMLVILRFVTKLPFFSRWNRSFRFSESDLEFLKREREKKTRAFCFFFSSAGEYEQGLALLNQLRSDSSLFVCLIFFSPSGFSYAKKKEESYVSFLFPSDEIWVWREFFSFLKPCTTLVVRHELWPGFLSEAKKSGRLFLINASKPSQKENAGKTFIKRRLLSFFHKIFVVNLASKTFFLEEYGVSSKKIVFSGDTKFEQVLDRKERALVLVKELRNFFLKKFSKVRFTLVAGSVWWPDTRLLLMALSALKNIHQLDVRFVLVPHQIQPKFFKRAASLANFLGLTHSLLGHGTSHAFTLEDESENPDVIFVRKMGVLAELYALADIAYVGGGIDGRVHNVLEPVVYGKPVGFGPRYRTSHEAKDLLNENLAEVLQSAPEIVNWCSFYYDVKFSSETFLLEYMDRRKGATQTIKQHLCS